ncbi:nucleotidyltransferase domain-containing protein [Nocardioides sp. LMS-CY]|uniref:nucleotidyltransferase domain-containing protein n=1 Tax=Nocardioides sp. (strain LMS-CY) TaxID=2840457 RepID=UPI001C000D9D|nr:nucleotidyltransferase domain-containing protein [Nocardioides sp. LMS-CY]QWF20512.1 nucleotidyltransferase domain-containing protein [Nocardioides sp. LMS-CY]
MDVSAPYETVVPSLDGAVLEVLARAGKPITGRQVQRLARRGSIPGVATVLDRLTETGIITAERAGSSILYEANREHLAWPAVEVLVGIRSSLLQRLGDLLGTWEQPPKQTTLFGSAARGDGDAASDIDILIVHRDDSAPTDPDIEALRSSVARWTGNHAQLVVVSESAWTRMTKDGDPLVDSIRRDGLDLMNETERVG